MRSLPHIFTQFVAAVVILALSILSACSDRNVVAPPMGDPGGPPSTVEVPFCTGLEPAWVGFQDGDGAWTHSLPESDGRHVVFRHSFAGNRGAIAMAQRLAFGLTALSVWYTAPAELGALGDTIPANCASSSKALLGSIAGLDTNDVATVTGGFSNAFIFPGDHTFVLSDLIDGPQTLLATRTARVNGALTLDKLILRRTPALPDSATIPVLDFDSVEAFAPAVANVTIDGLAPEGGTTHTRLVTTNSQNIISFLSSSTTAATRTFNAIPESRLAPSDLQALTVSGNPSPELTVRSATIYFHAPVDQTIALGPAVATPAITVVSRTPALRLRTVLPQQSGYERFAAVTYQQGANTLVSVGMTAAYASLTTGAYDLTIPDLSGAAGFDPQWALRNVAGDLFWSLSRVGGTLGFGFNVVPTNGALIRVGARSGNFTP